MSQAGCKKFLCWVKMCVGAGPPMRMLDMGEGDGLDMLLPSLGGNSEGSDPILLNMTKKWGLRKPDYVL